MGHASSKKTQLLRIISKSRQHQKSFLGKAFKTSFRQAEFARHAISQKINLPVEKKPERADIERSFVLCAQTQEERRQHIEGTELVSTIDLLFGLKEGARGDKSARALFTSYTHATPFPTF